jgi:hypothetical protein
MSSPNLRARRLEDIEDWDSADKKPVPLRRHKARFEETSS